jgi:hypothetical protein
MIVDSRNLPNGDGGGEAAKPNAQSAQEYDWDLDFTYDPAHFPSTVSQTVYVYNGWLTYTAEKDFDADWPSLDGQGDFILVKSREDVIGRLELHRQHVADQLARLDATLAAAKAATGFYNDSEYAREDGAGPSVPDD